MINELKEEGLKKDELQKVKNKAESSLVFSETELLNRATNLAYYEYLGGAYKINEEVDAIKSVTDQELMEQALETLKDENSSVLYYQAIK